MKVLFLTDNYPPEVNAPAARTSYHCKVWAEMGADVTVVTCAPNFPRGEVFPGYGNRLRHVEVMDDVRVIRVWSYISENRGFFRRTLDYASFAVSGTVATLRERFDVVVATSPQFFTAVAGSTVGSLKRRPWVFEVRDLWPESIVATGAISAGRTTRLLERIEHALYRKASAIVPVTHSFKRQLVEGGVDPAKIHVVTNGVDLAEFPDPETRAPSIDAPFVVGYLGTHGLAHGLDLVLRVAPRFDPEQVEFVLVGDGAKKDSLVREARERGLRNVHFRDPISRDQIPQTLAGFDASLVPLKDSPTFRSVIPSKLFEAAAAGLPILLGVQGEAQAIVESHAAGLAFAPENEDELEHAIQRLLLEPNLHRTLAHGSRQLAAAYDRRTLAKNMLRVLETVVRRSD